MKKVVPKWGETVFKRGDFDRAIYLKGVNFRIVLFSVMVFG